MTIQEFANLVTEHTKQDLIEQFGEESFERIHKIYAQTSVVIGKKYTKVDVGRSGKFMIDSEGNIFGIKAYGVIHRGHHYGTLETTSQYFWGSYYPQKIKSSAVESEAA